MFYSTGDEKYLKIAKETADLLDSLLPKTNLVPQYYIRPLSIRKNSTTVIGTSGQTNVVEYVSHLALLDSSYIELTRRLANGLMQFCINKENNLAYNVVSTNNGDLIKSESFGFESHLGAVSSSVVEALITAYKATNDNNYKNQAIATLKSIWSKRNRENNLIPETRDIVNDTIGTRLYPNGRFRYDDFGGAYIRALTLTYQYTQDKELLKIMEVYTRTLIDNIWDKRINGGAFRYLTNLDGKGP